LHRILFFPVQVQPRTVRSALPLTIRLRFIFSRVMSASADVRVRLCDLCHSLAQPIALRHLPGQESYLCMPWPDGGGTTYVHWRCWHEQTHGTGVELITQPLPLVFRTRVRAHKREAERRVRRARSRGVMKPSSSRVARIGGVTTSSNQSQPRRAASQTRAAQFSSHMYGGAGVIPTPTTSTSLLVHPTLSAAARSSSSSSSWVRAQLQEQLVARHRAHVLALPPTPGLGSKSQHKAAA